MADYETSIRAVKDFLRASTRGVGDVVEIDRHGPNMRYYGGMRVTASSPTRHAYAAANAAKRGLERFDVIEGVAENLPMPDASADAVVGTLVNCSVASVARAAAEAKRVLRPGGVYLFLDHVAAPSGTPLLALQKTLEPLNRIAYEGCRLTRDPVADIEAAGFGGGVRAERFLAGSGAIETSWLMQPDAGEAARRIAAPGGVMQGIEPLPSRAARRGRRDQGRRDGGSGRRGRRGRRAAADSYLDIITFGIVGSPKNKIRSLVAPFPRSSPVPLILSLPDGEIVLACGQFGILTCF